MGRKKYVIVMAAGSGTRMGSELPKQFIELDGKAILQMTIETFLKACPDVSVITVLRRLTWLIGGTIACSITSHVRRCW